ncbi:kinase-like domain-containing protein [Talaromyces proteolyticus]|uniref:Kinase-like domain-containing protein n=1 Tax=Talaromyces proteolyticus TaxID=1131652 RepID=A0AAD4PZU7_9EURO|nr:kinase-like domain-containing protein [Talaromyces proteolyticus]KAH8696351.1 kinase-like domain-containing protein [Talaromyces proteolyticus]
MRPSNYNIIGPKPTNEEDLEFNNTIINCSITLLGLKTTAHFFSRTSTFIPISKYKIVKKGFTKGPPHWYGCEDQTEAATLRFLARKTSLPVPKVYCSFRHKNHFYIVMERIQGETLSEAWPKLSKVSKYEIYAQLRDMFQELRSLEPHPHRGVESTTAGSLRDFRYPRVSGPQPRFGSFRTIQEFHRQLRNNLPLEKLLGWKENHNWQEIKEVITKHDGPWPPPVFTHANVSPSNILVRGDKVVGIVDWEFSGWYPHYWEYTSAWFGNSTRPEWQDELEEFLDPFPMELEMETIRRKWWGRH